jgi:Zn-dependent protease
VTRAEAAGPSELWSAHQQALAQDAAEGRGAVPVASPAQLRDAVERHHALVRDFHLARKLFRPLTEAERRNAEALAQARRAMEAGGFAEHADVLAEIQQQQQKKTGWAGAILILFVSMALFVGAGAASWSWEFALLLVPILLFHEAGHYLAMRAFGYRNLRMFFIPLFGAAVSGQNYNVAGWKKVVVSLMGPVPGIVLGTVLGIAGVVLKQEWLTKAATLTLILNAINLVPVLPLDGGWVAHALLFSRHWLADVLFRGLASLALVGIGLAIGDRILWILGGFMLLGLPIAYRVAGVTRDLRREGFAPVSPDDQTIPPHAAATIAGRLRATASTRAGGAGASNTKLIAQQTLQVFEALNARPPGVAASLGLAAVHGASVVLAGGRGRAADRGGPARFHGPTARRPRAGGAAARLRAAGRGHRELALRRVRRRRGRRGHDAPGGQARPAGDACGRRGRRRGRAGDDRGQLPQPRQGRGRRGRPGGIAVGRWGRRGRGHRRGQPFRREPAPLRLLGAAQRSRRRRGRPHALGRAASVARADRHVRR